MTSGSPDGDLVSRLRRRQPGAFDELYRMHRDGVWRFLRRLAGSTPAAEDLFQDTWVAAARNASRLREDTQLAPWLYAIARNKHRNALRNQVLYERRRAGAGAEPAPAPALPDAQSDARARARRVAAAFDRLADAHREILLLSVVEGMDAAEIARVLDLHAEAVRKRLSRARAELLRLTEVDR